MGAINGGVSVLRALKNLNTGGRGLSGLFKGESWINPYRVNLKTGEMGANVKNGVSLKEAKAQLGIEAQAGDKLVGTVPNKNGKGVHFIIKDAKGRVRDVNTHHNRIQGYVKPDEAKKFLQKATKVEGFNYAPIVHDTDRLTKKSKAIGLGALGYGGYELYEHLSPDSDGNNKSANVIANAAKANTSQNTETTSDAENNSENKFGIADAEPSGLFKSGVNKPDNTSTTFIQPPKAKTNVKPKKPPKLNYDPIAEWAREDQATNDKWLKRQADYKKLVDEGVDPYDAYDRTVNLYN